jgi:hypothetical protein
VSSVRVSIRIPAEIREAIEDQGHTISEVVREALDRHVRAAPKKPSCYEVAERLGLIGSIARAPKDLSTGKHHFRGFGRHVK